MENVILAFSSCSCDHFIFVANDHNQILLTIVWRTVEVLLVNVQYFNTDSLYVNI